MRITQTSRIIYFRADPTLAVNQFLQLGSPSMGAVDGFGVQWARLAVINAAGTQDTPLSRVNLASDDLATSLNAIAVGNFNYGFDGTNWDRVRVGVTNADNIAVLAAGALQCAVYHYGFDGATWDRIRSGLNSADAVATLASGVLQCVGYTYGFSGTNWDRIRSGATNANGVATLATGALQTAAYNFIFNGATWDRWTGAVTVTGTSTVVGGTADNADAVAVTTNAALRTTAENYGFNGTTWDRIRSGGNNADDVATTTLGNLNTISWNYGFDGTTWDRYRSVSQNNDAFSGQASGAYPCSTVLAMVDTAATLTRLRGRANNADAITSVTVDGCAAVVSTNFGLNAGTGTWDRIRAQATNADGIGTQTNGALLVSCVNLGFNGTNFDRLRTNSAANVSAANPISLAVANVGNWSQFSQPAANTQATTTRAAGGAGVRHVCTSISASYFVDALGVPANVVLNLRDGATGAGAILWSQRMGVGALAVGSRVSITLSGLSIFGTANTAMTLEFNAAGGAVTFEDCAITGYSTI